MLIFGTRLPPGRHNQTQLAQKFLRLTHNAGTREPDVHRHSSLSVLVVIATTIVFGSTVVSCGTDEKEVASIPRVFDPGKTVTYADLQAIGFKKSKEYNVEGLTGADSAYYGFWGWTHTTGKTTNSGSSRRIRMQSNSERRWPTSGLAKTPGSIRRPPAGRWGSRMLDGVPAAKPILDPRTARHPSTGTTRSTPT